MNNWEFIGEIAKKWASTKTSEQLFAIANDKMAPILQKQVANRAMQLIKKATPKIVGESGQAMTAALGAPLAIAGAAKSGWDIGRILGQTPLLTDPNMSYDQFYQQIFSDLFKKKISHYQKE